MLLDRLLVSGDTYTIAEVVAPARYRRDRLKRTFTVDDQGNVTFEGDAGGYSSERIHVSELGQWISVVYQLDDPVDWRTVLSLIEDDEDTGTRPSVNPYIEDEDDTGTRPWVNPYMEDEDDTGSRPWVNPYMEDEEDDSRSRPGFNAAMEDEDGSDSGSTSASDSNSGGTRVVYTNGSESRVVSTTGSGTGSADDSDDDESSGSKSKSALSATGDPVDGRVVAVIPALLGASALILGITYRSKRRKEHRR
jgi:hypothetical protein